MAMQPGSYIPQKELLLGLEQSSPAQRSLGSHATWKWSSETKLIFTEPWIRGSMDADRCYPHAALSITSIWHLALAVGELVNYKLF
jgi:hypothetical protein